MVPFLLQEQSASSGEAIGGILMLGVVACIYFLPAYVGRKKRNADSITLLNLFLGWTLIGWVVALVWATSNEAPTKVVVAAAPTPAPTPAPGVTLSVADELEKLVRLRDNGALTEAEFTEQKARVLNMGAASVPTPEPVSPPATSVPISIQIAQLRHRHHRGEISEAELGQQMAALYSQSS